jgi:hypothetical protein
MKKHGQLSDLAPVIIYGLALLFAVLYVWRWTSDETWGPGGNFSYAFSPGLRMTAGLIAIAFMAYRFVVHLPRRFSLRTLLIATTLVALVLGAIVYAVR